MFNKQVDTKEALLLIVKERIDKWCMELDLVPDNLMSLWNINPNGAILLHQKGKRLSILSDGHEDFVGFCDGSWQVDTNGRITAGVGGYIVDRDQNLMFIFSGPIEAGNALKAEMNATKILIQEFCSSTINKRPLKIYTDCIEVVNSFSREKHGINVFNDAKWFGGVNRDSLISVSYVPR